MMLAISLLECHDRRAGLCSMWTRTTRGRPILLRAPVVAMGIVDVMRAEAAMVLVYFSVLVVWEVADLMKPAAVTLSVIVAALHSAAGWDRSKQMGVVMHAPPRRARRASTASCARRGQPQILFASRAPPLRAQLASTVIVLGVQHPTPCASLALTHQNVAGPVCIVAYQYPASNRRSQKSLFEDIWARLTRMQISENLNLLAQGLAVGEMVAEIVAITRFSSQQASALILIRQ